MSEEEFWNEIHKNAVDFRNKKRKEYLDGTLPENEKWIVERWDCDKGKIPEKNEFLYPRIFPENLREESLSLDVRRKFSDG